MPQADAARIAALPPVAIMFAALLGYNPVQTLLGPALSQLPASHAAYLTGHTFFPSLISAPFQHGLAIAFDFAIAACLSRPWRPCCAAAGTSTNCTAPPRRQPRCPTAPGRQRPSPWPPPVP